MSYTLISPQYLDQRREHNNQYSLRKEDTVPGSGLHVVIDFIICLITLTRKINLEIFSSAQNLRPFIFVIISKNFYACCS